MSTPQTWEGQQPHAIGSQHMASQPRPQGKIIRNVLAHPSKLICTEQRQYMALKTSLDNPRRKASFFTGQFKALLVTHWCHFESFPQAFPCCLSPFLNCSAMFSWSCHCNICQPGCECPYLLSPLFNLYIPSVSFPLYSSLEHLFIP